MTLQDWVDIGKRRVVNILRSRLYATIRQLEVKISEAGPNNQRAEPVIVTDALRELQQEGAVSIEKVVGLPNFYYLNGHFDLSKPAHAARRQEVINLQRQYNSLSQKQAYCGDALETVVWNAINGLKSYMPLGSQGKPLERFGEVELPGSLDFTLLLKEVLLAGEMKNLREWIYPQSQELWGLLGKAVRLLDYEKPVLPIFIARKIPYITRKFMSEIGVLGFEMHHQYFVPKVTTKLAPIKDKNGLGFHDIVTDLTPPAALINFFTSIIPKQADTYAQRFRENKELIAEYAIERKLESNKFEGPARREAWNDFQSILHASDEPDYDDYTF